MLREFWLFYRNLINIFSSHYARGQNELSGKIILAAQRICQSDSIISLFGGKDRDIFLINREYNSTMNNILDGGALQS